MRREEGKIVVMQLPTTIAASQNLILGNMKKQFLILMKLSSQILVMRLPTTIAASQKITLENIKKQLLIMMRPSG